MYSVNGQQFASLADAQDAAEQEADKRMATREERTVNGATVVSSPTMSDCTVKVIRDDGTVASTHRPG